MGGGRRWEEITTGRERLQPDGRDYNQLRKRWQKTGEFTSRRESLQPNINRSRNQIRKLVYIYALPTTPLLQNMVVNSSVFAQTTHAETGEFTTEALKLCIRMNVCSTKNAMTITCYWKNECLVYTTHDTINTLEPQEYSSQSNATTTVVWFRSHY